MCQPVTCIVTANSPLKTTGTRWPSVFSDGPVQEVGVTFVFSLFRATRPDWPRGRSQAECVTLQTWKSLFIPSSARKHPPPSFPVSGGKSPRDYFNRNCPRFTRQVKVMVMGGTNGGWVGVWGVRIVMSNMMCVKSRKTPKANKTNKQTKNFA